MTDTEPSVGRMWNYRFLLPGREEIEQREFSGDDTAEAWGRDLSKSHDSPIVIERHSAHVDDWEYVVEVG